MEDAIKARVLAGGLWLDLVAPGWQEQINWNFLDLGDPDLCVAGQVFHAAAMERGDRSGYSYLGSALGLCSPDREGLGFYGGTWEDESRLEAAWRALWAPHADYPHESGTLYDCPACGL